MLEFCVHNIWHPVHIQTLNTLTLLKFWIKVAGTHAKKILKATNQSAFVFICFLGINYSLHLSHRLQGTKTSPPTQLREILTGFQYFSYYHTFKPHSAAEG